MWRLGVDTHGQTQDPTTNYICFPHVSIKSVKSYIQTDTIKNEKMIRVALTPKRSCELYFLRITLEDMVAMLNYLPTSVTDRAISRGFIFVNLCIHEVRENKPSQKVSNLQ